MKIIRFKPLKGPKYSLKIRETQDGRIQINDHPEIDIAIIPEESKIVLFPKTEMNDFVYLHQNALFEFLTKQGQVLPESIQGGDVYFSLEGRIVESKNKINPIDLTIANQGLYQEEETDFLKKQQAYEKELRKRMYAPDEEESTEFGEVPHSSNKGNIPRNGHQMVGYGGYGSIYESKEEC